LLNRFGKNGGFRILRDRFTVAPGEGRPLTFPLISALIRPFGLCHEVLTVATITTYFLPVVVSWIPQTPLSILSLAEHRLL